MQTLIDDTHRPSTKRTSRIPVKSLKKQTLEEKRIAQEKWDKDFALTELQFVGYEALQLAFDDAIKLMRLAYELDKPSIKQVFEYAFETYLRQIRLINLVQQHGVNAISTAPWANPKWYNLTEKDLFFALKPEIQKLLRKKGVRYDK